MHRLRLPARPPSLTHPRASPHFTPSPQLIHSGMAEGEFVNQALVALPLAYICGCAYFSLFKVGNFGFYHVVGGASRGLGMGQGWGLVVGLGG